MPLREVEICSRLRKFRKEQLRWSQPAFARELIIDSFYLSNLEQARTPLRYVLARLIFKAFPLNPHWLATGTGTMASKLETPSAHDLGVDERALFSRVYDEKLRDLTTVTTIPQPSSQFIDFQAPDPASRVHAHTTLAGDFFSWLAEIPDDEFNRFVSSVHSYATTLKQRLPASPPREVLERFQAMDAIRAQTALRLFLLASPGRGELTTATEFSNTKHMGYEPPKDWKELRRRLKDATNFPNAKAELARHLKVTPSAVSQWLSGHSQPTVDMTFQLLQWVKEAENKKAQGRADNTPKGHKTQQRKSSSNETKSGPKSP